MFWRRDQAFEIGLMRRAALRPYCQASFVTAYPTSASSSRIQESVLS